MRYGESAFRMRWKFKTGCFIKSITRYKWKLWDGNCAVIGCTNSSYRLTKWEVPFSRCTEFRTRYAYVNKLSSYPGFRASYETRSRENVALVKWNVKVKRKQQSRSRKKWSKCFPSTLLMVHLGLKTQNLGYETGLKCARRVLHRNPNIPKGKIVKIQES